MSKILDWLYLGDVDDAHSHSWLHKHGITHVLNCAEELPNFHKECFVYMHCKLDDDPEQSLKNCLTRTFNFIEKARKTKNGRVLVHCYAGISRSASIVIHYLMRYYGMSFEQAKQFVKSKRSKIDPNKGFKHQLRQIEMTQK